jgi:pimeloyl-ACP methyl ester carboxylesterase
VTPLLTAAGRAATAVDMEGHGLDAALPASALARPFDAAAFAIEPSPHLGVTLETAAARLVDQIAAVGRPVVLVGHSMAGHVITAVAQQAPELIERLVYICGLMPASGADAGGYVRSRESQGELIGPLVVAEPGAVGAIRLDVRSPDATYRAGLREALYGDVSTALADGAIRLLSPDLPLGIPAGATDLTAEAWGSIPRTYIRCSADRAILPALQARFIAEADAAFPANATRVVDLDASHSPFLSMPDRVAAAILEA